ncbi:tetratricopeptide repeat protein [Bacillus sp. BHET2]|uniref:tetratricopeptide repeat protein n=1 Tax=Bacillus sp. BHET2 TaxID=2583818 RepID=UPI00110DAEA4|nr:tetratricopeptide repeat protein [Bacillus sp. BHET2]TMU88281.1 tetratricopeptide repeat protein [Bacillus sp. BHET2]
MEAVPYYEKAIHLGLDDHGLQGAYIGLGSTYRSLGKYEESLRVFRVGIERFPDNKAMTVFYSMTLYNLNEHSKAMELLLTCIGDVSEDATLEPYKKAIAFYSKQLDTVWQ